MTKILFITDVGSPWGGSEELWSKVARKFSDSGYSVHASASFYGELHPKLIALKESGVQLHLRKSRMRFFSHKLKSSVSKLKSLPIKSGIEKVISKLRPDFIVFSQSSGFSMYREMNFCKALNIPYISVTQLNSEYSWPTDENFSNIRSANANSEMNYFVSHGNMELFKRQIALDLPNLKVISNPYNFDNIQKLAWPGESTYNLAYVGRLDFTHKGIDILLSSFSDEKWKNRNFTLNIYGKGNTELAKELAKKQNLSQIKFHGHVSGIQEIWRQNHMLVMASRYEGMPLSIIEAMFCQRPVLTTDVAGHAEYITEGVNGYLAAAPKISMFKETLERAWNTRENWKQMGEAAFKSVEALSTADPVGLFYNEIKQLLGQKNY